jgi:glycerate-2-kinase
MTSNVKAGGFAKSCTAGRLIVLVLSDVLDNSLEVIDPVHAYHGL